MMLAKIALSAATFAIDRPYSYRVPAQLENLLEPGMRVLVPFGKGNGPAKAWCSPWSRRRKPTGSRRFRLCWTAALS